MTSGLVDFKPT